jgi:hypothetical protein
VKGNVRVERKPKCCLKKIVSKEEEEKCADHWLHPRPLTRDNNVFGTSLRCRKNIKNEDSENRDSILSFPSSFAAIWSAAPLPLV